MILRAFRAISANKIVCVELLQWTKSEYYIVISEAHAKSKKTH